MTRNEGNSRRKPVAAEDSIKTTITISRFSTPRLHAAAREAGRGKDQTPAMVKQLAEEALMLREMFARGHARLREDAFPGFPVVSSSSSSATEPYEGDRANLLDRDSVLDALSQFSDNA
ncbi:hypothetical protein [Paraburkholderia sp. C35]|uniref:hypothetical protein n=1 Tax=Paraburkholderia sp. C35 TaxID=2126993 RepID=UPI000D699AD1|nr:hypothetical protein [Paraburkholderia sp. C35]